VISYADRVKVDQLQVPEATLRQYGAVSEQTAAAMASGVRQRLHADLGVSITGVAGPEAEGSKPVGLTFIGIAAGAVTLRKPPSAHSMITSPTTRLPAKAAKITSGRVVRSMSNSLCPDQKQAEMPAAIISKNTVVP